MDLKNYEIRPYNAQTDFDSLFKIWMENHLDFISSQSDEQSYREMLFDSFKYIDGSFQIFVAVFQNEIVGYQAALPMRNNPATWKEHALSSTYVAKAHQGSGIGYELLKMMFEHLPNSNIKLFFGQAKASNVAIIKIGEKLGFKKIGDIPSSNKIPVSDPLVIHVYNVPESENIANTN